MRFFGSILLLITSLFGVEAHLLKSSIIVGERAVLILSASGKEVEFPEISNIAGYDIISTSTQRKMQYINGKLTNQLEKHYAFMPLRSVDIAPFEIEVDGVKKSTKPLRIEVKKTDISNSPFTLEMRVQNTEPMQFEAVAVEFIFKRNLDIDVAELRFTPPKPEHFWTKDGKKSKTEIEGNFAIHKMNFFIFPQKSGSFEIYPAQVDVGLASRQRDIFSIFANQLNWKRVFSNSITLHVQELVGTNLHGNFDISLQVDSTHIEQGEGVNATLTIVGDGNFDDIEAYKIEIEDANVFADRPLVKTHATQKQIKGEFIQKFSISSNTEFTIPPLSITYFDAKAKKLVTKKTEAIDIHVRSGDVEKVVQFSPSKLKSQEILIKSEISYIGLSTAFLAGVLTTLLIIYIFRKKELKLPRFRDDRELLKEFLKFRGASTEIDEQIKALEENIYADGKNIIDKKLLKSMVKQSC